MLGDVHHVGIACADVEQTLQRLSSSLDIARVDGPVHDPLQDATLCMITLRDGSRVELVAGAPVTTITSRGGGPYHVCFAVPAIDEAVDSLQADGWRVVSPPTPAVLFGGARVAFLMSPAGLTELVEVDG